jgi:hypothetical protein
MADLVGHSQTKQIRGVRETDPFSENPNLIGEDNRVALFHRYAKPERVISDDFRPHVRI